MRIAVVIGEYPEEQRRLREEVILSYATETTEIGLISVPVTPYTHLIPADISAVAPVFIDAFRRAEEEGYDAVVPLGTLDLGVWGGKSAVGIPVVGPTESMLHVADMVGTRFGVITYGSQRYMIRSIIRGYHYEDRIVDILSPGFGLPDIAENKEAVVESFLGLARELIDRGADVILPCGITQCPVHIEPHWLEEQLGVPVVEGIGTPIRVAEALVRLGLLPNGEMRREPYQVIRRAGEGR